MDNIVLDFFGFSQLPFSKNVCPKNVFEPQSYKEAFARLGFGVSNEDILLITGPIGSGKSVLLRSFISSLDSNQHSPVYLPSTNISDGELYKVILGGLKIEPPHFAAAAKRLYFKSIPDQTKKPVVVIDDAQELTDSALIGIKSMVNFDFDSLNKITFILAGEPELKERLGYSQFLSLKQRIRVSFEMYGMSLEETCQYIDHHTSICGRPSSIFADDAKSEIYKRSSGMPRMINTICYKSILYAATNEIKIIDSSNLDPDDF